MKTVETIAERVTEIIRHQLCVPVLLPESKLREDLGADSLDTVELFMYVEEEFGVNIPDEVAEKLATVQDVIAFVEQYQRNR